MKRFYAFALMVMLAFPAIAGDSAIYFDPEHSGNGLNLLRNGDRIQITLFDYTDYQGCWGATFPESSIIDAENCSMPRFFLSGGDLINASDTQVTGWFYAAYGVNYPEGLESSDNPFEVILGDSIVVGVYTLQRQAPGWRLRIIRVGEVLDADNIIFDQIYNFSTPLFYAED